MLFSNMPLKHQFTALFILVLLMSSCSSIYMPGVPNTPMLTNKGEFAGGGHVSLRGNLNFNAAYAVNDYLAVITNMGSLNTEGRKKDISHKYFEVGGGYFKTFGPNDNRVLEFYAGMGTASSKRIFRDYEDDVLVSTNIYDADYSKMFFQVNYASKEIGKVKLFGTEFGLNYGTAWRISFAATNDFYKNHVPHVNEDNIFIEPVFYTRMVLSEHIQLQYSSGSNFGLKKRKFLNAGHSIFSVGAVFNIGGKH